METPPEPSEPSDLGSDHASLRDIANQRSDNRDPEPGVDYVEYHNRGADGLRSKEHTDLKQSIKLERGAEDLKSFREQQKLAEEREAEAAIRQHVDNLRRGGPGTVDQQQPPQWSPEQQNAQQAFHQAYQQPSNGYSPQDQQIYTASVDPQFMADVQATQLDIAQRMQAVDSRIAEAWASGEAGAVTEEMQAEWQQLQQAHEQISFVQRAQWAMANGMSPKVATAVADREVLQWIQQSTDGFKRAYEEATLKQVQDSDDVINISLRLVLDAMPELQGVTTQREIDAIFKTIQRQNPARADYIHAHLTNFQNAIRQGLEVKQRAAQIKAERFAVFAKNEDDRFRWMNPEFLSPAHQLEVSKEALSTFRENRAFRAGSQSPPRNE